jgi:hypothetical protein
VKDNTIKLLLGVIAFCLCVLLLKETAYSVQAQSQPAHITEGQGQIAASDSHVYILLDRKLYVYSWETKNATFQQMSKEFGPIKLNRTAVIDVKPTQ